jgi:hypothetical protein
MRAYLLLGVATLSLGACKLDRTPTASDNVALTAGAPFQLGLAPTFDALPYAPPAPVSYAPQPVAYDYWNDAYAANQTYYDQPPAYMNYAGATPLVWAQPAAQPTTQGIAGALITRIVEALVGGGQREYYYQPGQADPYFVRDPQYAYAFDDGQLAAVYDPYGVPLAEQLVMQVAPNAGRYLVRADTLRDAAVATALRQLTPEVWTVQRTALVRDIDRNEGWKTTWIPGANRSPVAIQRLAEVRARKELRDEDHAAWKAQKSRDKDDRKAGKTLARLDRDDDHRAGRGSERGDDNGRGKGDKGGKGEGKGGGKKD